MHLTICPPRRPGARWAKNAFADRYNRMYAHACLAVARPSDEPAAAKVTAWFKHHSNDERPNQALSCGHQPPCVAFHNLPARPPLPTTVDPDRWLMVLDGRGYARNIRSNGTVKVDTVSYSIDQARAGQDVSLRIDAAARAVMVEARAQVIKGRVGERLPWAVYLDQIASEARTQHVVGRPIGQQLRLW